MQDWYQTPALVLTILLLPGFGQLYWRTRDIRNLLWFLAFLCAVARMLIIYPAPTGDLLISSHPWKIAAAQSCALFAAALFLGSLSPLSFRIGKQRILYAIPFTVPLVVYAVLAHGVFHLSPPQGIWVVLFAALGLLSIGVALLWAVSKGTLPAPIGVSICVFFGGLAAALYLHHGLYWPLVFAESGCNVLMAFLVISAFRRLSPGVVVSVVGFIIWAAPILRIFRWFHQPGVELAMMRCIAMGQVVAAFGLLFLALENEIEANRAAGERERRARREMEAYGAISLQRRRVEDFDRLAHDICELIRERSRFGQVALLLLQPSGTFRLAGSAGLDGAVVRALDALAERLPVTGFLEPGSAPAVDNSQTMRLDLRPHLLPGDDLEQLRFTSAWAVPLRGRNSVEGVLLVSGLKENDRLRLEDLVPLENFMARLQAMRSQTRMLEKLIDAEKFAGLGQLAGNVFDQLSNPLTVMLGYASLLEEAPLDAQNQRAAEAILSSARSMRSTLESLQRITRSPGGQLSDISAYELLGDMERLHRSELLQRGIEFRLRLPEQLPRIVCQPQQLRQAILHCLQYAMDALDRADAQTERVVRLEASAEGNQVQIVVAHTGPGFDRPDRAFDPFVPPRAGGDEAAGLGLSLCATILRDNNGRASAVNLQPAGAAITLKLQAAGSEAA